MDILSASLGDLLSAVAADRPSPGAGAAAGVALALGAACAAKALRISARRGGDDGEVARLADAAEKLAERAVAGAQDDCEDFPELLAEPDDPRPRRRLSEDGEASMNLCRELRALIETHADRVAPDLAGDLAAALHLVDAAERISWRNLSELEQSD